MRQRDHGQDLVSVTYAQLNEWAARVARLANAVDGDDAIADGVVLAMEIKSAADNGVTVMRRPGSHDG